ncbi:unnamed protein product [Rhizoctonia solani]|uniref:Uncharacterized protein n=1 Tax=Rhizoctonia solani TaxID=456999 RepID=A0A8H2XG74_9AGAM|nr:unnamed protein product [Rhizoctonia solani]
MREVSSVLLKSGEVGAKQSSATNTDQAMGYNAVLSLLASMKKDLQKKHVLPGGSVSLLSINYAPWSHKEKRALQKTQKVLTELYDGVIRLAAWDMLRVLSTHLPDPKVVYAESEVGMTMGEILEVRRKSCLSLQEYVRERMEVHFQQVERYGFGKAEELTNQAEKSMTEIWVSALGMMKDGSCLPFL